MTTHTYRNMRRLSYSTYTALVVASLIGLATMTGIVAGNVIAEIAGLHADTPRWVRIMTGLATQDLHPTCTTDTDCERMTR